MDTIDLTPKPGYVIKTRVIQSLSHPLTTKVFINLCHDPSVPKPLDFDTHSTFNLIIENKWEIPLILSKERTTSDKKGTPSILYDCIINPTCFTWITLNPDLRSIMNEWAIESVELLYSLTLERDYSIPKMLSKGDIPTTTILKSDLTDNGLYKKLHQLKSNETLGLLEELKSDESDTDLPNLMNIEGKKKLLIEVIDVNEKREKKTVNGVESKVAGESKTRVERDLKGAEDLGVQISGLSNFDGLTEISVKKLNKSNEKDKLSSASTKSGLLSNNKIKNVPDSTMPSDKTKHSTSKSIEYSLSFHKIDKPGSQFKLLVKFTSTNVTLTDEIDVEYKHKDNAIRLTSDFKISGQNYLDIPLSIDIDADKAKSLLVNLENSLHVFV